MEVLENREAWLNEFQSGWLAHLRQTGETDWKRYNRPNHSRAPVGPGLDLGQARLLLIPTAGAYLRTEQAPFDDDDPLGDYSLRTFPSTTSLGDLAFSHSHYDHTFVQADPQVLVPLRHLEDFVREGVIGELTVSVISLMGYMPVATELVDETIPAILEIAREQGADAALLVPA